MARGTLQARIELLTSALVDQIIAVLRRVPVDELLSGRGSGSALEAAPVRAANPPPRPSKRRGTDRAGPATPPVVEDLVALQTVDEITDPSALLRDASEPSPEHTTRRESEAPPASGEAPIRARVRLGARESLARVSGAGVVIRRKKRDAV